jgi:hypothetical protein
LLGLMRKAHDGEAASHDTGRAEAFKSPKEAIPVRLYAQFVGPLLVVLGLFGLFLGLSMGEDGLIGIANIDTTASTFRIVAGAIIAIAGFLAPASALRVLVGVAGVVYLLVAALAFYSPDLFELLPTDYTILDNLIHLAVGGLGVAMAFRGSGPAVVGRKLSAGDRLGA